RTGAGLAYDPSAGDLVLAGGSAVGGAKDLGDLWELRGDRWVTSAVRESAYSGQVITYDAKDHEQLLFGGGTIGILGNATWAFQNGSWKDISNLSASAPGPRFSTQMTYDARDGYALVFGGYGCLTPSCGGIFGAGPLNDTWSFAGGNWSRVLTRGAPPTTENGALTYDSTDRVVVLVTECTCSTFLPVTETWTYAAGNWTNVTSAQTVQPSFGTGGVSMADSPWDKGVVLFGGQGTNSTWLFSNGTWSNVSSTAGTAPASRYDAAFALDSTLGSAILFGGALQPACSTCYPAQNDTWEYHHGQWVRISSGWAPSPRYAAQGADDPAGRGLLLWGSTGGADASDTWTFGPAPNLSVDPRAVPTTVDVSVPVHLFSVVSGGLPPYMVNWTAGSRSLGSTPTVTETFGSPGHYTIGLQVTDAANNSVNAPTAVGVVQNLSVAARVGSSPAVAGTAVRFLGSLSGGVGPFLTKWRFGDGGWNDSTIVTHVYQTAGSYTVWFWGNDSAGAAGGIPINLTVSPALSAAVFATPNVTDVGVAVQFSATAIGGVPPVTVAWNFGDGATTTGRLASHSFVTPGRHVVVVWVNDSVAASVNASTSLVMNSAPIVSVNASGPVDLGQYLTVQAETTYGTGADAYAWQGLPPGCSAAGIARITCVPSSVGDFHIVAVATDAAGTSVGSSPVEVLVVPMITGSLALAPKTIDLGQPMNLSVNLSGGAPPFMVAYSGLPPGCAATQLLRFSCTPSVARISTILAVVTDAAGATLNAGPVSLTVNGRLAGELTTSGTEITVGGDLYVRAIVTGGTAPITYSFSGLPTGCATNIGPTVHCAPSMPGSYGISVFVEDGAHAHFVANASFTVDPVPAPAASSGGVSVGEIVGFGAAALAAIAAAVVVARRRRGRDRGREAHEAPADDDGYLSLPTAELPNPQVDGSLGENPPSE
ncbi:MAG: PKD domain-containing protein, partial [Thermoplasmata archaeon]|nr:PKD domain-containing protein [Thermoplasmata archaeon]